MVASGDDMGELDMDSGGGTAVSFQSQTDEAYDAKLRLPLPADTADL